MATERRQRVLLGVLVVVLLAAAIYRLKRLGKVEATRG